MYYRCVQHIRDLFGIVYLLLYDLLQPISITPLSVGLHNGFLPTDIIRVEVFRQTDSAGQLSLTSSMEQYGCVTVTLDTKKLLSTLSQTQLESLYSFLSLLHNKVYTQKLN